MVPSNLHHKEVLVHIQHLTLAVESEPKTAGVTLAQELLTAVARWPSSRALLDPQLRVEGFFVPNENDHPYDNHLMQIQLAVVVGNDMLRNILTGVVTSLADLLLQAISKPLGCSDIRGGPILSQFEAWKARSHDESSDLLKALLPKLIELLWTLSVKLQPALTKKAFELLMCLATWASTLDILVGAEQTVLKGQAYHERSLDSILNWSSFWSIPMCPSWNLEVVLSSGDNRPQSTSRRIIRPLTSLANALKRLHLQISPCPNGPPQSKAIILLTFYVELIATVANTWAQYDSSPSHSGARDNILKPFANVLESAMKTDVALRSTNDLPNGFRRWTVAYTRRLVGTFQSHNLNLIRHPYLLTDSLSPITKRQPSNPVNPQLCASPFRHSKKRSADHNVPQPLIKRTRRWSIHSSLSPSIVALGSGAYDGIIQARPLTSGGSSRIYAINRMNPSDDGSPPQAAILKLVGRDLTDTSNGPGDLSDLAHRPWIDCNEKRSDLLEFLNDPSSLSGSESDRLFLMSLREVQFLWELEGSKITPTLYDVLVYPKSPSHTGEILVMTMERADGGDLQTFIDGVLDTSILSIDTIWHLAWRLLDLIHGVHTKEIIHSDLKPLNIVFARKDSYPSSSCSNLNPSSGRSTVHIDTLNQHRMHLIDFGIAEKVTPGPSTRPVTSVPHSALTTTISRPIGIGSLAYLAPESIRSICQTSGQHLSRRVDIWAFGAILWRIIFKRSVVLSGRPPGTNSEPTNEEVMAFAFSDARQIEAQIHSELRTLPERIVCDCSSTGSTESRRLESLGDLLTKCLQTNSRRRPCSQDLQNHPFIARPITLDPRSLLRGLPSEGFSPLRAAIDSRGSEAMIECLRELSRTQNT